MSQANFVLFQAGDAPSRFETSCGIAAFWSAIAAMKYRDAFE